VKHPLGVGAGGQFGRKAPFQVAAFCMFAAPNDDRVKRDARKITVPTERA